MMKKMICFVLSAALLLSLVACGKSTEAKWQEQYDLGVRYLSEGNYEEAIIAFTAAIEIEPKKADAYLALAEVYIAQNDFDKALQILEDAYGLLNNEQIKARIEDLKSGSISDFWGNLRKISYFDENGKLLWVHEWDYDNLRKKTGITCYDSAGAIVIHLDYEYDEKEIELSTLVDIVLKTEYSRE